MKLAFVTQPYDRVFPPTQNSIGLIVHYTALELARGIDVTVHRKDYRDDVIPPDLPFSVASFPVNRDRVLQKFIRSSPWLARWLGIDRSFDDHTQYRREVSRRVATDRPDIVHVMNYWNWSRELKAPGAPHRLVLEMQCEWLSQRDRGLVRHQLEAVDAVVAVSDHVANTFLEAFPDFPGLVATVGNGVDVTHFRPSGAPCRTAGGRRKVLFVGRVSPEKGMHTLLEAFGRLAGTLGDVDLEIAGPMASLPLDFLTSLSSDRDVADLRRFYDQWGNCTYWAHLQELLDRYRLRDRVRFLGAVSHKELVSIYHAADVVVNPSLSESFGISVVEGMACGIPVVGTRVGGMCETILSGTTGILVERDAPQELANAVASILADPIWARKMGTEGRKRAVQTYSWQARAERLEIVYQRLLEGRTDIRMGRTFRGPLVRARSR